MSRYLTLMSPCPSGSFFVAASIVNKGGAFPYALLPSLSDLREFLEKKMGLDFSVVEDFMRNAEIGGTYGCIARLPHRALKAILENQDLRLRHS